MEDLLARLSRVRQKQPPHMEPRPRDWSSGENQERLYRILVSFGVPPLYARATWAECRADKALHEYTSQLQAHVGAGRGLLLLGPVGTGKSSAAGLVAAEAVKLDLRVKWWYVPDLLSEMRDAKHAQEIVRASSGVDVLVWDDFGVAGLAEWQIGMLDRIVENRYHREKLMIVTTNLSRKSLEDPSLARLNDRWAERRFAITISGESMRRTWKDRQEDKDEQDEG